MAERQAAGDLGDRFLTLHEIVKAARLRLAADNWDFLTGAAETETSLRRNRLALDSLGFRPRVLRDVSQIDPQGELLGRKMRLPVVLAPIGSMEYFDREGAAGAARAAARHGLLQFMSSVSQPGLEAAAAASPGRKIFQLYVRGDAAWVEERVRRAADAGYEGFCFTVDTAHYSRRERDLAKRVVKRSSSDPAEHVFQAALAWDQIKRFKDKFDLPLVIKGIATAEDAGTACEHGAAIVYVSNHGGRQLDYGRGTIDILPEVVAAVRGRAEIIVDGGFYRGTDVIKAMALGADAVAVGRLYVYGLAAAGEAGVLRVLELLETEIVTSLGLLGVTRFADLTPAHLSPAPPVTAPHVTSAFPLLDLADPGYGGGR